MAENDPRWEPSGSDNNVTVTREYLTELYDEIARLKREKVELLYIVASPIAA